MKYNNKSDIWSLGCVLYESITLKPPFRAMDMEGLCDKVIQGNYENIPKNYSKDLSDLVKMLLNPNPDSRPSCEEILGFEFVNRHFPQKILSNSSSALINPIKIPKEISMLSYSLPRPDYEGFDAITTLEAKCHQAKHSIEESFQGSKLPVLKINPKSSKKYIEMHKVIENSTDRLKRIREIYLSPSNIFITPNNKRANKHLIYKRNNLDR